jgi:exoribonuclease R
LKERLLLLRTIAFSRRESRSNCELFDKNEVVFQLDESNMPIEIGLKKRIDSEKLIEEFMILTNCEVAKKLVNDFGVHALLIYHPKPLDSNLSYLNDYISELGVKFKADNLSHLEDEFKQLFEKETIDDGLKQLLLLKAIQIQEFAVYTRYQNTYKGHFGLSLEYYTHFTSPVRRFADLMVHEQLERCISNQQLRNHEIVQLEEEIELINRARARGKRLKQLVVECFINLFLYSRREKIRTKGFIIKLGLRSATIFVPTYNLTKEVSWRGSTAYLDKDRIELAIRTEQGALLWEFQKNDSIDIEMNWEQHQEVQLNLIVEHEQQEIRI